MIAREYILTTLPSILVPNTHYYVQAYGSTILNHYLTDINGIPLLVATNTDQKLYMGQVATRCYMQSRIYTNNSQTMSRSYHFARESITFLQVGITNWYAPESDGTNIETDATASATITASIEYPLGTFKQLLFNGSTTATGLPGTNTISDSLPILIPKGAKFYVRIFRICASCAYTVNQPLDTANGDGCEIANSGLTDKTISGTVGTAFSEGFYPAFIIANTNRPSVLLVGDSRVLGNKANLVDTCGDQGNLAPSVGPFMGYINVGTSGDSAQHFVTSHTKRVALANYTTHVIIAYGINDIQAYGRSSTQLVADLATIVSYFPNKKVFICTIEPYSTDATTPRSDNATGIVPTNKIVRAGFAGTSGMFDISDIATTARDSGLWKTGYSTDFLHGNAVGNIATKNSGIINIGAFTL